MLDIQVTASSKLSRLTVPAPYETIIVLPMLDAGLAKKAADVMRRRTEQSGLLLLVEDDMRLGFVMVANVVYIRTASRYFAYVAQDAYAGGYWLDYALETLKQRDAGLLAFNEGRFFGKIAAFGLADRHWVGTLYTKFLFFPKYKSHFADMELSQIAATTNKLAFNPNALLMEVDYEKHAHPVNEDDKSLYIAREQTGFDGIIARLTA